MALHKTTRTMQYTETVYRDHDGSEVEVVRNHDDTLWDESEPEGITRDELEDFYPDPRKPGVGK